MLQVLDMRTNTIPSILIVVSAALFAGCVIETNTPSDSTLEVRNNSDFEIHEMYVTGVGSPTWNRNLLGNDVLFPGERLSVGINCGTYDALLIDETNAQCELHAIDLCFANAAWEIRNDTCAVFQARLAESQKLAQSTNAAPAAP